MSASPDTEEKSKPTLLHLATGDQGGHVLDVYKQCLDDYNKSKVNSTYGAHANEDYIQGTHENRQGFPNVVKNVTVEPESETKKEPKDTLLYLATGYEELQTMDKNADVGGNNKEASSPPTKLCEVQDVVGSKDDEVESKIDHLPCSSRNSSRENDPNSNTNPSKDIDEVHNVKDVHSHEGFHKFSKLDDENRERQHMSKSATTFRSHRYGWVIVFACFLSHLILGTMDRMDGIFYLLFLDKFHHSAQLTAWPLAIASSLQMLVSPVASAMCDRYSTRTAAFVGGAVTFVSMVLSSLAPNFYFLFFSHALVGGIGRGLPFVPGLILINKYFKERVGMATALATTGVGIGTFTLVPLVQYLSDIYGYLGTFLILGGIACNMFVVAMLYRPLSMHLRFKRSSQKSKLTGKEYSATDLVLDSLGENDNCSTPLNDLHPTNSEKQSGHSEIVSPASENQSRKSSPKTLHKHRKDSNCLTSSLKIIFPIEETNDTSRSQRKLFHFDLLKQPSFLMYCSTIWFFSVGFRAAFTFLPALVKYKGNSDYEAALSLSIAGVADMFGRLGSGIILDLNKIRPFRPIVYIFIIFGMALACFILPSLSSFATFVPLCIFYGMLIGAFISHKSIVLLDIVGRENMAKTLGILISVQGVSNFIGPPISGALKDIYGSYNPPFYFGGSVMMLAGFSMVLCNLFQKKKSF